MKLHELVAATHSPFHADGSIAPEVVATQAAFLAANGIRTIFMTGSTGESHSLTTAEKLALYDAWGIAGKASGLKVIAHVGSNCVEDSKTLARRAGELGGRLRNRSRNAQPRHPGGQCRRARFANERRRAGV